MSLLTQVLSGIVWMLYGSFFEYYWHRFFMHKPRFPHQAFKGHTIVHHGLYKGEVDYFCREDRHPEHILLKPYAFPGIVIMHVPIMLLINHFIPNTFIGAVTAMIAYFVVYEYLHFNMHVPRGRFVERFGWFQFLRTHHRLHHTYYQKNFCVLLPVADWMCGTLVTEKSLAKTKANREAAIDSGKIQAERKPRRKRAAAGARLSRIARESKLGREFFKFKTRRTRANRKRRRMTDMKVSDLRELLHIGRSDRDR